MKGKARRKIYLQALGSWEKVGNVFNCQMWKASFWVFSWTCSKDHAISMYWLQVSIFVMQIAFPAHTSLKPVQASGPSQWRLQLEASTGSSFKPTQASVLSQNRLQLQATTGMVNQPCFQLFKNLMVCIVWVAQAKWIHMVWACCGTCHKQWHTMVNVSDGFSHKDTIRVNCTTTQGNILCRELSHGCFLGEPFERCGGQCVDAHQSEG